MTQVSIKRKKKSSSIKPEQVGLWRNLKESEKDKNWQNQYQLFWKPVLKINDIQLENKDHESFLVSYVKPTNPAWKDS